MLLFPGKPKLTTNDSRHKWISARFKRSYSRNLPATLIHGLSLPILDRTETIEQVGAQQSPPMATPAILPSLVCSVRAPRPAHWEQLLKDDRLTGVEVWLVSVGDGGEMSRRLVRVSKRSTTSVSTATTSKISRSVYNCDWHCGSSCDNNGRVGAGRNSLVEFVEPDFRINRVSI